MDESPMSHALGAVEFAGGVSLEEPSATRTARRAPLPWRTYTRCLLLAAIVGAVGWTASRPGLLRLSILMSLVSPSRGESLAWKPEAEEEPRRAPTKFTPPPDEWRLSVEHTAGRMADRPSAPDDAWRGGTLGASAWKRESFNPWDWSDDAARGARRITEPDNTPAQKPESSFRASEAKDWPLASANGTAAPADRGATAATPATATPAASDFAGASADRVPSIAPLAPLPAIVHSATAAPTPAIPVPQANPPAAENEPAPALSLPPAPLSIPQLPQLSQLPQLPAANVDMNAINAQPSAPVISEVIGTPLTQPAAQPIQPAAQPQAPQAAGTISPAEALSAAFAAAPAAQPAAPAVQPPATSIPALPETPVSSAPTPSVTPAPASVPPAPAPVDWKEREITGPIPGAYLTIYPKLKFIGLCVPGQGYIRKYNQIAVPMDLTESKQHAADGRTPYGKYYVAGHIRDAAGSRVVLSWPSVDDARRAGVGPEMLALVDDAWSRQAMPPQDSFAGGGLSLAGDRAANEYTSGGFSLEAPHMEEIFTALPDGAWVFVQQ